MINTGFTLDTISTKDAVHENIFGGPVPSPIESVGRLQYYQNELKDTWLFQSNFLSCLTCTTASAITWRIFDESNHDVRDRLAWLFIFRQVPKLPTGTRLADNLQFAHDHGVCTDALLPQESYVYQAQNINRIVVSEEAREDALKRAGIDYKKYIFTGATFLMDELKKYPIMIGAYFHESWWSPAVKNGEPYSGAQGSIGHEVLWIDNQQIDGKWYRVILDWDQEGKHSIKYLPIDFQVAQASAVADLPGDWRTTRSMFRLVRNTSNGKVYFVNSDDAHIWVDNPDICIKLIGQRAWNTQAWTEVPDTYFDTVKIESLPFSQFFTH